MSLPTCDMVGRNAKQIQEISEPTWESETEPTATITGNIRTEPGTGNQVLEEPELEERVTRTELVEP